MLVQLIFSSTAPATFSTDDVCGVELQVGERFLYLLEGSKQTVNRIYSHISSPAASTSLIRYTEIKGLEFLSWVSTKLSEEELESYSFNSVTSSTFPNELTGAQALSLLRKIHIITDLTHV